MALSNFHVADIIPLVPILRSMETDKGRDRCVCVLIMWALVNGTKERRRVAIEIALLCVLGMLEGRVKADFTYMSLLLCGVFFY